jgi:hypothetical protein
MKQVMLIFGLVLLTQVAFAQTAQTNLPCDYSGDILPDKTGKPVRFTSNEMKARATRKVDIGSGFMGHRDFSTTFLLEVLVGPTGKVVCTRRFLDFPLADAEVEKAVRQWEFRPAKHNGKAFASLGLLQFRLCNTSCGKQGMSMSLLH